MTPPELIALRQESYTASSAFTRAQNAYWAAPHEEQAYRTCQETAAQSDAALTALLAYLGPDRDAEHERTERLHTVLQRETAFVEERAQLATHRTDTR